MSWKASTGRIRDARRALVWRAVHWGWREFQRAGIVTAGTPAGRVFRRFGDGSVMAFPAGSVFGEHWIHLGAYCIIGEQVTLTAGMMPDLDRWVSRHVIDRLRKGSRIGGVLHAARSHVPIGNLETDAQGSYQRDYQKAHQDAHRTAFIGA